MKFLAIIDVAPDADIETIRAKVPDELEAAWKLYASGALREAYLTDKPSRVVFILEARDAEEAEETLNARREGRLRGRPDRAQAVHKLVEALRLKGQ